MTGSAASRILEKDALYYPYIHIRSVDWLKRALLVFPHVARIVPREFYPADIREIWDFENELGRRNKPLLRSANLDSAGVWEAQRALLRFLREDFERNPALREKYRYQPDRIRCEDDEFLLHEDKPLYELVNFLFDEGLMWRARFSGHSGDTAVHPTIGTAIMSTIAMACAQDEGFDIVTDDGRIHYEMGEGDVASIYRQLFRQEKAKPRILRATENELCELIIFQQCDVSKLTPEGLRQLSQDREAIDDFRLALAGIAAKIPELRDPTAFEDRLKGAVDDALKKWRGDRMNMSKVSKEMFGRDILKPTEGFVKSLVEKLGPPAISAVGGVAAGGASGVLLGAAGGFVVALLIHGLTSWTKVSERARQSPYRYLTKIEEAGVAFTVAN